MHPNQNTLMPESYFSDDEKWIKEMWLPLSEGAGDKALAG